MIGDCAQIYSSFEHVKVADKRDFEDAYQEAQRAQVAWAKVLPSERSLIMRRAPDIMDARREEIISWSIREAGSPRKNAHSPTTGFG
jgi:aldehyde dehydrogenase (NAD+)